MEKIGSMTNDEMKDYFVKEYNAHKHTHNLIINWDHQKLTCDRLATIIHCCKPSLLVMFFRFMV